MKKISNSEFINRVKEEGNNEYIPLSQYVNNKEKILFKHKDHTFEMTPSHFFRGQRCPICNGKIKKTNEEFKEEISKLVGSEYTVLGEYINTKTKIKMKHTLCGMDFEVSPKNFINNGNRCPHCRYKRLSKKNTMKDFKERVFSLVGSEYTVLEEYKGSHKPIKFVHNSDICGNNIFSMRPNDFLNGNHRCPKCARIKNSDEKFLTTEDFLRKVYNLVGDEYTFLEEYSNSSTKLKVVHNICHTEYSVTPNNFINQGNRCPHCFYLGKSQSEKDVVTFIKSIYDGSIVENFIMKNNKELDIYIPDLKIAFEFDGLYWHSEAKGKDKKYHLNKTISAKNEGITLYHIFEDEWANRRDIVKSKIRHLLNLNNSKKIYARKCYIREIDSDEKDNFLEINHIQGKDKSNIKLGLFTATDELVSVITFGKLRSALGNRSSKKEFELIRFASDINKIVIGGFSKLFKYFKENYDFDTITTYADRRWSTDSNIYGISGFIKSHESEPNYWYFKNGSIKREHRYSYRKNILNEKFPGCFSDKKTEKEIMKEANFNIIWDCGNFVYKYKKEDNQ